MTHSSIYVPIPQWIHQNFFFGMDPSELLFDIKAYKRQTEIKEHYMLNQFRECGRKIEEDYLPRSKRRYSRRDHTTANKRLMWEPKFALSNLLAEEMITFLEVRILYKSQQQVVKCGKYEKTTKKIYLKSKSLFRICVRA